MGKKVSKDKQAEQIEDFKSMLDMAAKQVFFAVRSSSTDRNGNPMRRVSFFVFLPTNNSRLNSYDVTYKMSVVGIGEDLTDREIDTGIKMADSEIQALMLAVSKKIFDDARAVRLDQLV